MIGVLVMLCQTVLQNLYYTWWKLKKYEFLVGDSLGVGTKRLPRIMNLILIFFLVGTQSFCQCSSVGILNVGFGGEWS